MSKSRLSQYLEADKMNKAADMLMQKISDKTDDDELMSLIIQYGQAMEHNGYDAGYEQGKKWPK